MDNDKFREVSSLMERVNNLRVMYLNQQIMSDSNSGLRLGLVSNWMDGTDSQSSSSDKWCDAFIEEFLNGYSKVDDLLYGMLKDRIISLTVTIRESVPDWESHIKIAHKGLE